MAMMIASYIERIESMKLHTLLQALPLVQLPAANPEITGLANDHRNVKTGFLFICIKGHLADGHHFADEAVKNGASAILAEQAVEVDVPIILVKDTKRALAMIADTFYGKPTQSLHLVGITGTNGKTTTSHIIEKIFQDHERTTGLIGTMYIKIADRVIETKNTTPDSLTLQQTFRQMRDEGVDTAIMEVSSHALVQGRVHGCDYDVAVFTNLTQDHLDYHETMEEYKRAKGLLFTRLGNTYMEGRPKFAVLNADDPVSGEYMAETAAHVITYGIDSEADFSARDISMDSRGTGFTLISPEGEKRIQLMIMGRFSVYNVLAAMAAGYVSNIPLDSIIRSVEGITGVSGRFEAVNAGQDFSVIVDYAHTPDSLENVLKTIRQFAEKRIFAVVGCGGDRDKTKRPLMARIAVKYATDAIFTSDNPRTEDPLAILADMEEGVRGEDYLVIPDRAEAINRAVMDASEGDVILIAGKGHETYQIIGNKVYGFDDRLVALQAIKERM